MNRNIWRILVNAVRSADRRAPRMGRRCRFSDQQIVKMYLWSVWHDRPLCWACNRTHYHHGFHPKQVPSISQFCRRVKMPRIQTMLQYVNDYLTRTETPSRLSFFDGKSLPISDYSCDPDARIGYGAGKFQRGYKLHAWATSEEKIPCFTVRPLNEGEAKVARELVVKIPKSSWVLADTNYDSSVLYTVVAERGSQLFTPLKGHSQCKRRLQRMGVGRRRVVHMWNQRKSMCTRLLHLRDQIERIFSALTCFGGGLTTLPPWVRHLDRVTRWVTAKIAIYHARLYCRKEAVA